MSKTVVIRADASSQIGSGHIMRCLALADELKMRGAKVIFISREILPVLKEKIIQSGHMLRLLPPPSQPGRNKGFTYAHWLSEETEIDARQTLGVIRELGDVNWLVVDHYGIDARWERIIKENVERLMVIDDMADRCHECDVLLDQTFNRQKKDYIKLVPLNCNLLLGSKYALLRPEFAQWRKKILKERQSRNGIYKILINFGSFDKFFLVKKVTKLLINEFNDVELYVVKGCQSERRLNVEEFFSNKRVHLYDFNVNMASLMAKVDLAVGAGGVTSWERCALGLPSIIVTLAKNQKQIVNSLILQEAAFQISLFDGDFSQKLVKYIWYLRNNKIKYLKMVKNSAAICDGKGAIRVAKLLIGGTCCHAKGT
ncbi:UDP-2,4-diacetamido-2,4,6-trideoxy-beta-L-altropyranose hydrolase [Thermopetrobacter sp. TC1]|uniref:UDP-2,4-diacetamido-2,4, 6-trideoxy-beta-L-altropyranose hydrolase n=1 Tax=Thermopetrobacter sp. TC1 TaxID=1495045 RepID=UPI0009DF8A99|nr:UDP-2,4-diacetamido-2,4,6-trideoxy-beta-L-altropyranose hydrolase [Thermopetrobacter sp. TC1]